MRTAAGTWRSGRDVGWWQRHPAPHSPEDPTSAQIVGRCRQMWRLEEERVAVHCDWWAVGTAGMAGIPRRSGRADGGRATVRPIPAGP